MKTKITILLGAVVLIVSTAFAFTSNSTSKTVAQKEKTTSSNSSNNGGGFVLEDADQWK